MAEIIAHHTGQAIDQVERDIDRDYFMTADDAKAYGLIDDIIAPRRGLAAPAALTKPGGSPESGGPAVLEPAGVG